MDNCAGLYIIEWILLCCFYIMSTSVLVIVALYCIGWQFDKRNVIDRKESDDAE